MATAIEYEKLLNGTHRYRAKLGPFSARGRTKTEARDYLMAAISREPSLFIPHVMIDRDGGIWTFFRATECWCYVQPGGCMCSLGERDVNEALNLFESHFAQNSQPADPDCHEES